MRRVRLAALLVAVAFSSCDCEENLTEPVCKFVVNPHDARSDDPPGAQTGPLLFGEVQKGNSRQRTITIDNTQSNLGLTQLQFTFSDANRDSFSVAGDLPQVNASESATITIEFSPVPINGEIGNTLTVTHPSIESANCPTYTVTLRGRALPPDEPDAGPRDAGQDAGRDAGTDAGYDAGPIVVRPDGGPPLNDAGHFESRGGLQMARSEHGAALLPTGEILVIGGFDEGGQTTDTVEYFDPATGISRKGPPLLHARAQHSVTRLGDGRIVVVGGVSSGAANVAEVLASVEVFDPANDTWAEHTISEKRTGHTAVALGDAVLVAWGWTQENAGDALTPATGLFNVDSVGAVTAITAAPDVMAARFGAAAVDLDDGTVLLMGGVTPTGGVLDDVVRVESGAATTLSVTLLRPRAFAGAARFRNGPVIVAGGLGPLGPVADAESLDPVTDVGTWQFTEVAGTVTKRLRPIGLRVSDDVILLAGGIGELPGDASVIARQDADMLVHVQSLGVLIAGTVNDLSVPRVFAAPVAFDGGIAFIGGSATFPRRSSRPDVDLFRPQQSRFESAGLIGPGGAVSGAAVRQVFVAGGVDLSTGRPSARTRLFNLEEEGFLEGPPLLVARTDATATLLPNGDILVAGGTSPNGDPLAHAERMRGGLSFSEPVESMVSPRRRHTATALLDGRVLLCGGLAQGASALDSCEIFDPEDNTFINANFHMVRGRYDHSATLLDDGRVLLTGGGDPALGVFRGDLFDPLNDTIGPTSGLPAAARRSHIAVPVGVGRVLIAGGETYVGARVPARSAEIFDAVSGQYFAIEDMDQARDGPAGLVFANGVVLISGGGQTVTGDDDFPTRALKRTEVYDPADGQLGAFRNADYPLTTPRARAVGADVLGQPVVLFGEGRHGWVGAGVEARVPLTTLELFVTE